MIEMHTEAWRSHMLEKYTLKRWLYGDDGDTTPDTQAV